LTICILNYIIIVGKIDSREVKIIKFDIEMVDIPEGSTLRVPDRYKGLPKFMQKKEVLYYCGYSKVDDKLKTEHKMIGTVIGGETRMIPNDNYYEIFCCARPRKYDMQKIMA
jgi:hypothetical protein